MSRDEIWDIIKEDRKQKFDGDRARFLAEAKAADDGAWTKHTEFHWSRMISGHKLDFWPSRKKFQYRGKVRRGDVYRFMEGKG